MRRHRSSTASPTSPAATRSCGRSASATARRSSPSHRARIPARHRPSSNGRAYYGTYENEVLAVDLKAHKIVWRYRHPAPEFPVLLLGGRVDGARVRRRTRQVRARDRAEDRQGGLDVCDACARWTRRRSSPASRVYIGGNDGKLYVLDAAAGKSVSAVRSRRPALGFARHGRREAGHRLAGRQTVLSGRVTAPPLNCGPSSEVGVQIQPPAYSRTASRPKCWPP